MTYHTQRITLSVVLMLSIVVLSVEMLLIGKQLQIADYHNAYVTCVVAHNKVNPVSRQQCANAQTATHTEFVCGPLKTCWLEVN